MGRLGGRLGLVGVWKATLRNSLLKKTTELGPAVARKNVHHKKVRLPVEIIQDCRIVRAIGIEPGSPGCRTTGGISMLPKQP